LRYELHRHPRSSHQQIAGIVRRLGRGPILDVGAAQGHLGRVLSGHGLEIDAIEPDPHWAAEARAHYRRVSASRIEDAALPARHYRVVVCADVLEHTVDPEAVLGQLLAASTPDVVLVVSLPNVAHASARALLLAGMFPQMERGIFDRTHLHFYTRSTAIALLRSAGLHVVAVRTTPVPLEEVWPRVLGRRLLGAVMRLQELALRVAPTLFAFQWILVARRDARARAAED
jgi:2-polyprenyl-3-methyl-5-hydroxy-6-metoxy-1,4-benzoquinol methylase